MTPLITLRLVQTRNAELQRQAADDRRANAAASALARTRTTTTSPVAPAPITVPSRAI